MTTIASKNEAVTLVNISKRFPVNNEEHTQSERIRDGYFYALNDISFTLESGSCTLIAGANGSGKSLLMSIIAGLEAPSSGTVKTAATVGLVFQEPDAQILGETPAEDAAFGARNLGLSKDEVKMRVKDALGDTGLADRADFPARSLSGGEKRRLAVAGVLAMGVEIIIFDEPYANMDYPGVVQVNRLVKKLHADGKTVIILTHELEKCTALADRVIVLCEGKKVFDGDASGALSRDLEAWGIHHPLRNPAQKLEDLLWQ
ncbi:MAG: energy-coupling factor ABC transporter ATP-binding protein [Treponema sp.]|nr:energy-coupling factor ABC transporter ATP-binding protein [Treponema sp.]